MAKGLEGWSEAWKHTTVNANGNGTHNLYDLEALPFFFAAVIIAHFLQAPQWRIDALAMAFVGLRIVYVAAYVKNLANLRSLVWVLALLANIGLLFAGMA